MKYGSQLKGWAVDRVLDLTKINVSAGKQNEALTVDQLISQAQTLADFCYNAAEDAVDIDSRIKELQEDLVYLQSMTMQPASNALDTQEGNA